MNPLSVALSSQATSSDCPSKTTLGWTVDVPPAQGAVDTCSEAVCSGVPSNASNASIRTVSAHASVPTHAK